MVMSEAPVFSRLAKIVGRQARKHRLAAGKSQDEIAESCGIYRTYLSRIEGGVANPTVNVLAALAVTLKVSVSDLVQETQEVN